MLVKIQESKKVYSIVVQGWKDQQWGPDLADELLIDMWWLSKKTKDFDEGYSLTQKEFDEFQEWAASEEEKYNNGESLEWLERNEEYPEGDLEEISIDINFKYVDED